MSGARSMKQYLEEVKIGNQGINQYGTLRTNLPLVDQSPFKAIQSVSRRYDWAADVLARVEAKKRDERPSKLLMDWINENYGGDMSKVPVWKKISQDI